MVFNRTRRRRRSSHERSASGRHWQPPLTQLLKSTQKFPAVMAETGSGHCTVPWLSQGVPIFTEIICWTIALFPGHYPYVDLPVRSREYVDTRYCTALPVRRIQPRSCSIGCIGIPSYLWETAVWLGLIEPRSGSGI